MSGSLLVINLIIAIAVVLFCILKLKVNPVISLILGSLYMGIASGLGLNETLTSIGEGFGGLMTGIGLPIGFGVILGKLLSDSGGAHAIAYAMVQKTSREKAVYAIGLTAFVLSIPVFYDVTFLILIPLGLALAQQTNKPLPYIVGAIAIGAGTAHTLVPPTPNPLTAGDILQFDIGYMVFWGLVCGLLALFVVLKVYFMILDRGIWNKKKDELHLVQPETSSVERPSPPVWLAIIPIFLPMILILLGTVTNLVTGETAPFIAFLSHRIVALLLGVIVAFIIAAKTMKRTEIEQSSNVALQNAGIVLLITGAGGAFGSVIQQTGIGEVITKGLAGQEQSVIAVLFMTYIIAVIFRIAQGSGTVASITTMSIMASAVTSMDIHGVWIALAALAGGISIGHVNDSGFWVTANLSGLTVSGGFKTYTLGLALVSVFVFMLALLGALIIPL